MVILVMLWQFEWFKERKKSAIKKMTDRQIDRANIKDRNSLIQISKTLHNIYGDFNILIIG